MFDIELITEILEQILVAARRIERRFSSIRQPEDFLSSDEGLDRVDAISMMLISIGESVKHLDRLTGGTLLERYPEIDWKGVKGARDILSHHYFDLNAEVIFSICRDHIPLLITTIEKIKGEVASGVKR